MKSKVEATPVQASQSLSTRAARSGRATIPTHAPYKTFQAILCRLSSSVIHYLIRGL